MKLATALIVILILPAAPIAAGELSFNRDIRPILSEKCFYCHGQDANKRKAELRLDLRDAALKQTAFVPGKPDESELIKRIDSDDADAQMPPPKSNRTLTKAQKELLRRWIVEGAKYETHWAYTAPVKAALPAVKKAGWVRNEIDRFVLAKIEASGLKPAPEADRATLIRRLSLDLIGLPPPQAEVDAFIADKAPDAYEKLVERLLKSEHYGERMALPWLDAARYADSNGFQQDGDTYQWVWRDWVVHALNIDMPFDQFSIEQLAGDLLPHPTNDQLVATAFNRNHLLNGEGGAIPEEQRFNILFDRVDTTATTWLGLTMACAQCHDHKYDPITQRDYYSLLAAFNQVSENGMAGSGPGPKRVAPPFIELSSGEGKKQTAASKKETPAQVMVMRDDKPRDTFVLERGDYLKPKEKVAFATPAFLPPQPKNAPRNRLGFAQWLFQSENPLTARVQMNRMWQQFFGTGFVKTVEDLGVQSEIPVHQELLDWLSVEFRECGWSRKHMTRLIVTSATYRQSSRVSSEAMRNDPENRLLSRGARLRMPAMILRDVALAASGLLDPRVGGAPVYPYQPAGVWETLAITKERDFTYPQSSGNDLYRRSLYTFWRRTVGPANMFDASNRQVCTVRQNITNTPLHALTTLNDPTWVEAARVLAAHSMESADGVKARLTIAFRSVLGRKPTKADLRALRKTLDKQRAIYRHDAKAAAEVVAVGSAPKTPKLDAADHAAFTAVCLALFNLDEALTRE